MTQMGGVMAEPRCAMLAVNVTVEDDDDRSRVSAAFFVRSATTNDQRC